MPMPFTALCREGWIKEALHILLTTHNFPEQSNTYLQLLQTCIAKNAISQGKQIHSLIINRGFSFATRTSIQNMVINMYVKCGTLVDARKVFDDMEERDSFSWNAIIAGYRRHGFSHRALTLFHQMQRTGVQPDRFTFATILPACAKMRALQQGVDIHQSIMERGFLSDVVVASALVDMYAKCGSIHKARELFDKMLQRNVVSWNAMIAGYAQNGVLHEALRLFEEMPQRNVTSWTAMIAGYVKNGFVENALHTFKHMQFEGLNANSVTFASILPACAKMGALEQGMGIHQSIMERGFSSDIVVASALVDMYAKCGSIHKACELFNTMPQRNVVSWNAMIAGYVQNGFVEKALETFKQMQVAGLNPNYTTLASILPACAKMGALEQGMDIHQNIMERGLLPDVVVTSALVDMYAKCGSICKACKLFDKMPQRNMVSWNAMIAGYAQNGFVEKAVETYKQMQLAEINPDSTTFASILPACAKMGALEQGMDIHQSIIESGFLSNVVVVNALIDMYAKCGSIHKALELFEKLPQRDVISWNAMVAAYAQNGFVEKALEAFKKMQLVGLKPNSTTFASILPACAKTGALEHGVNIHQRIMESGFWSNGIVMNALIDMYAKCGSIHRARELFHKMAERDVISWNTMVAGYALNGFCKDALKMFDLMKHSGTYPNHVSFTCVLFACSHAGLVDDGCKYFNDMSDSYCVTPTIDHYVCIVDLLGRAGYLKETLNFIIKMPIKPVVVVWTCLLGVCRSHKNIGLGEFTATLLFELHPKNSATYILLSNLYAEIGWWGEVQKVRRLMTDRGIKKRRGCSWIESHKMVHAFCVGDGSHTQTHEIYTKLDKLSWEMKVPDSRNELNDVEEEK